MQTMGTENSGYVWYEERNQVTGSVRGNPFLMAKRETRKKKEI